MTYPLRFPDDDSRFNNDLIAAVATVLMEHGYPQVGDDTFADLRAALAGFLYGPVYNRGDRVTWVTDSTVWAGTVQYVAVGDDGPVARIDTSPQPGYTYSRYDVVPCRDLTLVPDGAS